LTSLTVESLALMGILAGALGGVVAALNAIFGGFKKLPSPPLSTSKASVRQRGTFFIFRVIVGAVLGAAITFWFASETQSGALALAKLLFIQFAVGLGGSLLSPLPKSISDGA